MLNKIKGSNVACQFRLTDAEVSELEEILGVSLSTQVSRKFAALHKKHDLAWVSATTRIDDCNTKQSSNEAQTDAKADGSKFRVAVLGNRDDRELPTDAKGLVEFHATTYLATIASEEQLLRSEQVKVLTRASEQSRKFLRKMTRALSVQGQGLDLTSPYMNLLGDDFLQRQEALTVELEEAARSGRESLRLRAISRGRDRPRRSMIAYRHLFEGLAEVLDGICPEEANHLTRHRLLFLKRTVKLITGQDRKEDAIRDDYDDLFESLRIKQAK